MIINIENIQKEVIKFRTRHQRWHAWFAWRPVKIDENKYAWLEKVYRCKQRLSGWVTSKERFEWHYMMADEYLSRKLKGEI